MLTPFNSALSAARQRRPCDSATALNPAHTHLLPPSSRCPSLSAHKHTSVPVLPGLFRSPSIDSSAKWLPCNKNHLTETRFTPARASILAPLCVQVPFLRRGELSVKHLLLLVGVDESVSQCTDSPRDTPTASGRSALASCNSDLQCQMHQTLCREQTTVYCVFLQLETSFSQGWSRDYLHI